MNRSSRDNNLNLRSIEILNFDSESLPEFVQDPPPRFFASDLGR